jgi:23S rRNA (guanosine2251-2'-O)-methyltransferase
MAKSKFVQIESKNALLELLKEGRDFERLYVAASAFKDPKTKEIIEIAAQRKIPMLKVSRKIINRRLRTSTSESVLGYMYSQNDWSLEELLNHLADDGNKPPFFLILDDLKYTQNIAAIMRSAFAAGVNGIIINPQEKALVSDETIRISEGAAERIPLVEMNLFNAIKVLKDNDIKVCAVHMDGDYYYDVDLRGPIALVLGAEDTGVSAGLLERCDLKARIPMREGIGSLNVSASAAVMVYEKLRQEIKGF